MVHSFPAKRSPDQLSAVRGLLLRGGEGKEGEEGDGGERRKGKGNGGKEGPASVRKNFFGHITRGSAGQLALTVLEGIMEGLRHQGRPRRQWIHDISEWTGCKYIQLKEMSQDRAQWRRKISEWSSAVANPHRGSSTSE